MAIVRAAQLRRFLVVGDRADLAPESRSREKSCKAPSTTTDAASTTSETYDR